MKQIQHPWPSDIPRTEFRSDLRFKIKAPDALRNLEHMMTNIGCTDITYAYDPYSSGVMVWYTDRRGISRMVVCDRYMDRISNIKGIHDTFIHYRDIENHGCIFVKSSLPLMADEVVKEYPQAKIFHHS